MNLYYVSLIGPLIHCYLQVWAKNDLHVRLAMNYSRLSRAWCSVYDSLPIVPGEEVKALIDVTIENLVEDWHTYELQCIEDTGVSPCAE
jgi:hypothetical protein